jgi:hypothetical protein
VDLLWQRKQKEIVRLRVFVGEIYVCEKKFFNQSLRGGQTYIISSI